jgi:predicted peptidase
MGVSNGMAEKLAERLADTPIWCFHGVKDRAVPVAKTREMVEALRAVGNPVKYTEYEDGTHNVWDRAYRTDELWKWVFSQRLSPDEVRGVLPPGQD